MAAKKSTGRPSEYSTDTAIALCAEIAAGKTLKSICAAAAMPAERTVFMWLSKYPPFVQLYLRARETRADARFERLDEVLAEVRSGKLEPRQAHVIIDAIKWQCGKENKSRYSERMELAGDPNAPLVLTVAETLRQRRAKRLGEGEATVLDKTIDG